MLSALVIENEPQIAYRLCHFLELLDISARPAYNPKAAWLGLDQHTPDLVFLSTTISDEFWPSLLAEITEHPRLGKVPIIIVSPGVERDLYCSKNVLDVIQRPASLEAIASSLRKAGLF